MNRNVSSMPYANLYGTPRRAKAGPMSPGAIAYAIGSPTAAIEPNRSYLRRSRR